MRKVKEKVNPGQWDWVARLSLMDALGKDTKKQRGQPGQIWESVCIPDYSPGLWNGGQDTPSLALLSMENARRGKHAGGPAGHHEAIL